MVFFPERRFPESRFPDGHSPGKKPPGKVTIRETINAHWSFIFLVLIFF